MDKKEENVDGSIEIPEDAIVVRPSHWSWLWWAVPWVVFALAGISLDAISFGILPMALAMIVIVPRYLGWRTTSYTLTEEYVIIQQGRQRFNLAISQIREVQVRPGPFGRTLGYALINLVMKDGRGAMLQHVPQSSSLIQHVEERMTNDSTETDESADTEESA
jgi:uncharacterized membrane protein YdbT with pleckstrin-like domain